jgi:hypothetical protein
LPLLANIYLHYVLDLWFQQWRRKQARGDVIITRYADDFIVGFQFRSDAVQFLAELRERLRRFALELHPEKTRLILFGRFAVQMRRERGFRKPETFNYLGFTDICGKSKAGFYLLERRTMRKRMNAKLKEIKAELQRKRHLPIPEQGAWLRGGARLLRLSRGAHQHPEAGAIPLSGCPALVSGAQASEPTLSDDLRTDGSPGGTLDSACSHPASLAHRAV